MPHSLDNTTVPPSSADLAPESERDEPVFALVIVWSALQPYRLGEVALLADRDSWVLGRGSDDDDGRLLFGRQRPGSFRALGPLIGEKLSRKQLLFERHSSGVEVKCVGQAKLFVNGVLRESAIVRAGDVLDIRGQLVLLVVMRPRAMPAIREYAPVAFGEPDAHGILGESPAAWALRDRIVAAAKSSPHVLVRGASGTGKELVARAIHALSAAGRGPRVARNAATFTSELFAAELFGNRKDFPNPGMLERAGLVGDADGGTLFLDEIAELPHDMQSSLLRVLDSGGEYTRFGETSVRRSRFRFIGATNRPASAMKHDFAARLPVHVELPTLEERPEDVPLLVRHLLLEAARSNPEAERFVRRAEGERDEVSVDPLLITALLRRAYPTNVRELAGLLWHAIRETRSTTLVLPRELRPSMPPLASTRPDGREEARALLAGLEAEGWNVTKTAVGMGMSRDQLRRLMAKHGLKRG